jgi:hypothetical protein
MGSEGGSVHSQPGNRVDGNSCHNTKEGFQVSQRRVLRGREGISRQVKRRCQKGLEACAFMYISC